MSFLNLNAPKRTDENFRSQTDGEHHREKSILEELPIDMVEQFPVSDSLHLLHLGIMRRLLNGWVNGNFSFQTKWSASVIKIVSNLLILSNNTMPMEIHRQVRGLDHLKNWKGTEYRTFLLYLGVVILKDNLDLEAYDNFLLLFCFTTIFTSGYYDLQIPCAEAMTKGFIESHKRLYGLDSIGPNVHNVLHIADEVRKFGELPSFSSYPFESFLHQMKRLIRMGKTPLVQVAKRYGENQGNKLMKPKPTFPQVKHETSATHNLPNCQGTYNTLIWKSDSTLKNDEKNCYFLTSENEIIQMINVTTLNDEIMIYGQPIIQKTDYFHRPIHSSVLHIYLVSNIRYGEKKLISLRNIKCKLIKQNYNAEKVFMPLLHTLQ